MDNLNDEESPTDLWLVRASDGKKMIRIESGARLQVGKSVWSPDKSALAIQLWRGRRISVFRLVKREDDAFKLVVLNEPDFDKVALSRLKGYSKGKLEQMPRYHFVSEWNNGVVKIVVVFLNEAGKDDNVLIECHVDASKDAGIQVDSVRGHVSDKEVDKYE